MCFSAHLADPAFSHFEGPRGQHVAVATFTWERRAVTLKGHPDTWGRVGPRRLSWEEMRQVPCSRGRVALAVEL